MKIIRNNIIPFKGFRAINLFGVLFVRGNAKISKKMAMKLHIKLTQSFKFQSIVDRSEYFQQYLSQDRVYITVWHLNVGVNLGEITHILDENKIKYRFESD